MGAWGYKPFENDDAFEWLHSIRAPTLLLNEIHKTLTKKKKFPEDIRAASALIIPLWNANLWDNCEKVGSLAHLAANELQQILDAQNDWILAWNDPEKTKRSIRRQIKNLRSLEKKLL